MQADRTFYSIFAAVRETARFTGAYRRIRYLPNTRCRPLFRHEHGYRVRPRILSRFAGCPEVSRGVRLIFCHFAASRSLDVEPGSKARDEKRIRRAARHPLKLWPRRQFRLFRNPLSRWSSGTTFRRNL